MESVLGKMSPFAKRTVLFVDTLRDRTGVADRIRELGLQPYVIREVSEVADKERCPHIDTILVDSLNIVSTKNYLYSIISLINCSTDRAATRA